MQQTELIEILPELKEKTENYKKYGVVDVSQEVWLTTAYDKEGIPFGFEMPLSAMKSKFKEMTKSNQDIVLLELVTKQKDILSSIR